MNKRQHNTFSFFMPEISFMHNFCVLSPTWCATLQDVYCVSCKQSFMLGNSLNFFSTIQIPNGSFKGPQIFLRCSLSKKSYWKVFLWKQDHPDKQSKKQILQFYDKVIKQIDSKSFVSVFCNSICISLLVKDRYLLKQISHTICNLLQNCIDGCVH